jgi:hypothetical protein
VDGAQEPAVRELAKEYPLPNEDDLIRKLLAMREPRVQRGPAGVFVRESHPKHHGCVRARFVVEPDLPSDLRVGVFAQRPDYSAWIRFSNASPLGRNGRYRGDGTPDVRGMAIKLEAVDGEKLLDGDAQDFLLVSAEALVARDLADFVRALGEFRFTKLLRYFLNPLRPRLRELAIGIRSPKRHASPLEIEYFTVVPFLLGDRAVKYKARPVFERRSETPRRASPDFLREAMRERLASGTARFDFLVQVQTDPYTMPIEDPSVVWRSPFRKVATIEIPAQRFDTTEQMQHCEKLSFNPWHSLPQHRPLGGINRARKVVYPALSKLRHERNAG